MLHCECGWKTSNSKVKPEPPTECEACRLPGVAEYIKPDEVAGMVCTLTELRGRRVQEHAEKHGYTVYQLSKNRWLVLRIDCPQVITYNDKALRSVIKLRHLGTGPVDWKTAMSYIRLNSPELPEYLSR